MQYCSRGTVEVSLFRNLLLLLTTADYYYYYYYNNNNNYYYYSPFPLSQSQYSHY